MQFVTSTETSDSNSRCQPVSCSRAHCQQPTFAACCVLAASTAATRILGTNTNALVMFTFIQNN